MPFLFPRKSAFAFVGTALLAACGSQLIWSGKYPAITISDYTVGTKVASDSNGNAFLAGGVASTSDTPANNFVAKYDGTGKLLWDKWLPPATGGKESQYVDLLHTDAQGNVYVGWHDYIGMEGVYPTFKLYKYSPSGEKLWSWSGDVERKDDVESYFASNGNLLVKGTFANRYSATLQAFSPAGVQLWKVLPHAFSGQGVTDGKNYEILSDAQLLNIVNLQGADIAAFSAGQLGFSRIEKAVKSGSQVFVLGVVSGKLTAHRIVFDGTHFLQDSAFNVVLGNASDLYRFAADVDAGLCFAKVESTQTSGVTSRALKTGHFDKDLNVMWQNATIAKTTQTIKIAAEKYANNACFTQYSTSDGEPQTASDMYKNYNFTTVLLEQTYYSAKTLSRLAVPGLTPADFDVNGNNAVQGGWIYKVGYDTNVPPDSNVNSWMTAAIYKHSLM